MQAFRDRRDAGLRLATRLEHLRDEHPIVLGLPRGGVPVAAEVAHQLDAPLDVIIVRKLGVPWQPELGMGAVGEDGALVRNEEVLSHLRVSDADIAAVEARSAPRWRARARRFRGDRPPPTLHDRVVILVDDGIATGGTAMAAVQVVRHRGARRIVLAVPVAPPDTLARFAAEVDEIVCLATPEPFFAIGQWYEDFTQVRDEEVRSLLADEQRVPGEAEHADAEVAIPATGVALGARLTVPHQTLGLVVFVHGSGSSRHSPRNRFVADVLVRAGLATLLFDLLTPEEELDRANVFDIDLLARRLVDVTAWTREQPAIGRLPIGYFGASTGAAAALWTAATPDSPVRAVVSRGGRPDLAAPHLHEVRAPTLLIVGGADEAVLELNREAARRLTCEHRIEVVPGATHLFAEPGALERVAALASDWLVRHLTGWSDASHHAASGA